MQASFIKNLVSILSVASIIKSCFLMNSSIFCLFTSSIAYAIFTSLLICFNFSYKIFAFAFPISSSLNKVCLCKLFNSIISLSIIVIDIPALTRRFAVIFPSAPAPIIKIFLLIIFSCPSFPISSRIICLLYLSSMFLHKTFFLNFSQKIIINYFFNLTSTSMKSFATHEFGKILRASSSSNFAFL